MALCARIKPLPMQLPFRPRVDESIGDQRLEHLQPRRALARGTQPRAPETVKLELLPQGQGQPARSPLPWPMHSQFAQPHANRIDVICRHRTHRKQRHLASRPVVLNLDRLAPRLALACVDLAQIKHLALRHTTIGQTPILDKVPVLVGLAVLHASVAAQEHGAPLYERALHRARTKVFTTSVWASRSLANQPLASSKSTKSQKTNGGLRKTG